MITFEVVIGLLFYASLIVLAIKLVLPKCTWEEVCIPVYGITLLFIGIFAIASVPAILWSDPAFWWSMFLAIGFCWMVWKAYIKEWIKKWNKK